MTYFGLNIVWHWSPFSLAALSLLCLGYSLTLWLMHRHKPQERPIKKRQIAWFCSAVLIIALFFFTPIDMIARTQLFVAHMFQAVFLVTFAAPCLIFSCPDWLFEPVFKQPITRVPFKLLTQPVVASVVFNATFLLWHVPTIFTRTLIHGNLYHVMLWSIFLTSLLNWWPLIGRQHPSNKLSYPGQMFYAFLDGWPMDLYALIIVFSGVVLYPYAVPVQLNIGAYADQAAAGALLLLPGIIDLVVMSPLFFRWMAQIDEKAVRNDVRRQALLEVREQAEREEAEQEEQG
ncbi:MAG: cytochrome c oxidase assembly protein, partial [Ktedonobacteraceae bacterium]